jgi:NAD(P)-dependent dehydrogenase (short-subunit alcohol dehydrogenase family)
MQPHADDMRGKVCLVTGATSGIGTVTARELARRGARVVLVGRNPHKCAATVTEIQGQTGNKEVESLLADLSSQQQVRALAREFLDRHRRLDVLVNNAGGIWLKRQETADGLETTFAVNHLAYFLLTRQLLDLLKASTPARVVNVSSRAHVGAAMPFDDLQARGRYSGWQAYKQSKLANLLFTYELARRLEGTGVTANALHPGVVLTGFMGNNGWRGRVWQGIARWVALSPEEGARTVVYLATAPEVATVSGRYFVQEQAVSSSPESYDEAAAKRLWQVSEELTGLAPVGGGGGP